MMRFMICSPQQYYKCAVPTRREEGGGKPAQFTVPDDPERGMLHLYGGQNNAYRTMGVET